MFVIVFGVSGAGKTVTGRLLAEELGYAFYDGDDFHPPANIEKMRRGLPLADEDRRPWLDELRALTSRTVEQGGNAVLACSALKARYRKHLRIGDSVKLVYLRADKALIAKRLQERREHFMPPGLLDSQFADLEEPQAAERVVTVNVRGSPAEIVADIKAKLAPG